MRSFKRFLVLMVASFQFANVALADSESELRLVGNAMKIKVEEMRQRVNSISKSSISTLNIYMDRCNRKLSKDTASRKTKNQLIDKTRQYSNLLKIKAESEHLVVAKRYFSLVDVLSKDCKVINDREKLEYCILVRHQIGILKLLFNLSEDIFEYSNQSSTIGANYAQCSDNNPYVSSVDLKEVADLCEDDYELIKNTYKSIAEVTNLIM